MDKLIKIIEELHPDVEDIANQTAIVDDDIIDSFSMVTIVSEIQETFDIHIPADKLIPENFNSVAAMFALIESLED
ncbi:MAG: phosphopantetheine-binding protein [Oscillospiraceae bacterium]|nr:phosphopantetheine-binding protein [Oscillospiraceae bacterium]